MYRKLSIRISKTMARDLREVCWQEGRSTSEVVRDCLRRYLVIQRFRALRQKALPFAEAEGILTDEDVFKTIS